MKKTIKIMLITMGAVGLISGTGIALLRGYLQRNREKEKDNKIKRLKMYYNILLEWLELKQNKKSICSYFEKNNYKKIAIYGIGELGEKLIKELQNSNISIEYIMDKNEGYGYINIPRKEIGDEIEGVDVIIVTPIFAFDEIYSELKIHTKCPIVSLEEIIYEN